MQTSGHENVPLRCRRDECSSARVVPLIASHNLDAVAPFLGATTVASKYSILNSSNRTPPGISVETSAGGRMQARGGHCGKLKQYEEMGGRIPQRVLNPPTCRRLLGSFMIRWTFPFRQKGTAVKFCNDNISNTKQGTLAGKECSGKGRCYPENCNRGNRAKTC